MLVVLALVLVLAGTVSAEAGRFSEFQKISTHAASKVLPFSIGNDDFIAFVNWDDTPSNTPGNVEIHRRDGRMWKAFQVFPSDLNAGGGTFFEMDGDYYFVVATPYENVGFPRQTNESQSIIYKWSGSAFEPFQSILAPHARFSVHFQISATHYLAFSSGGPSRIFKYSTQSHTFVLTQMLDMVPTSQVIYLSIAGDHFLAYSSYNYEHETTSVIARWSGSAFEKFQSIPTVRNCGWEHFHIDNTHYLIMARCDECGPSSDLFRWSGSQFVRVGPFGVTGARWKPFHLAGHLFFGVAGGACQGGHNQRDNVVYQWKGNNALAELQRFPGQDTKDVNYFESKGESFLVVANWSGMKTADSIIYKWTPPPSQWSEWSVCSSTCGGGSQTRSCAKTDPNAEDCQGASTQACNTALCPFLQIVNHIPNQVTKAGETFNFVIPPNTFSKLDITLTVGQANGQPLPAWIYFTPSSRKFIGYPSEPDVAKLLVKVVATDQTDTVEEIFSLVVQSNQPAQPAPTPATRPCPPTPPAPTPPAPAEPNQPHASDPHDDKDGTGAGTVFLWLVFILSCAFGAWHFYQRGKFSEARVQLGTFHRRDFDQPQVPASEEPAPDAVKVVME